MRGPGPAKRPWMKGNEKGSLAAKWLMDTPQPSEVDSHGRIRRYCAGQSQRISRGTELTAAVAWILSGRATAWAPIAHRGRLRIREGDGA
jgi:hypothetical protein